VLPVLDARYNLRFYNLLASKEFNTNKVFWATCKSLKNYIPCQPGIRCSGIASAGSAEGS